MKWKNIFKRKPSELETVLLNFFKGDGLIKFAEAQSKSQQKEQFRLMAIKEQFKIQERHDYLLWRKHEGLELSEQQQNDFDFTRFKLKPNTDNK